MLALGGYTCQITGVSQIASLLSTKEAADILNYSIATVKRLALRGELTPAYKVPGKTGAYLFTADEVERYRKAAS